jgi:hypothetical protein
MSLAQSQTFTSIAGDPYDGITVTYPNVVQVNYGSTFTVFWSAAFGPVEAQNAYPAQQPSNEVQAWTAISVTAMPTSP